MEQPKDITKEDVEPLGNMVADAINEEIKYVKHNFDLHGMLVQSPKESLDNTFEKSGAVHARKSELEARLNRVKERLERLKTSDAASPDPA